MTLTRPAPAHLSVAPTTRALALALGGVITALVGAAGAALGGRAIVHPTGTVRIGWLVPLTGLRFRIDPLGGLLMAITGAVAVAVGVYAIGYARREHLPRFTSALLPVFAAALLLVPAAASIGTFLYCWELMAVTSLLLVLTEHRRPEARRAGVIYAVLTQLGFLALVLGLLLLASGDASAWPVHPHLSSGTRDAVFLLTLVGFGSKAGLVPLHAWLPRAHPEAPTPVSALMSAAMVNLGIYGLVRVDLQLLGPGPRWWGLVVLIVGALTALFGVLQASVATDLKRLLAYSTIENMGLLALSLGAALLLIDAGAPAVASIALTALLLHLVAHAAFKTLAFLAAGSVLAGTGERDLDRLGGLARPMPVTTTLFGVAAFGACGLPLGAGFVSEWLLLQALIHSPRTGHSMVTLVMPLALGAVALTTGLAVAAMVKAFGVGFLARPRSTAAAHAREASPTMLGGMVLAAAACVLVAVAPALVAPALTRVLRTFPIGTDLPRLDAVVRLPGVAGSIAPGWLAVALAAALVVTALLTRWGARRRPAPITAPLWACGAAGLTPRMEYTATSFAQPLQRVFDDMLRPDTDIQVDHYAESQYLVAKLAFRARPTDAFERFLYRPIVSAAQAIGRLARRAHSGSVHLYLGYGALGLLIVLVVAR